MYARRSTVLELQHAAPQIIERINDYHGFDVVRAIRFAPGEPPPPRLRAKKAPHRKLDDAVEAEITAALEGIEAEDLSRALARLGRTLKSEALT